MKKSSYIKRVVSQFHIRQKANTKQRYFILRTYFKQLLFNKTTYEMIYSAIYSFMIMFILTLFNYKISIMMFIVSISLFFWYQEVKEDIKEIAIIKSKEGNKR